MAKGKKRSAILKQKRESRTRKMIGGGRSRYAMKHRGGGNTGPGGMWEWRDVE